MILRLLRRETRVISENWGLGCARWPTLSNYFVSAGVRAAETEVETRDRDPGTSGLQG